MSRDHLGVDPEERRDWLSRQARTLTDTRPSRRSRAKKISLPLPQISANTWSGRYKGSRATVTHARGIWQIELSVPQLPADLTLGSEASLSGWRRLITASDVETGDPEFDALVRILGPADHILACTTADARRHIGRWVRGGLTLSEHILSVELKEGTKITQVLKRLKSVAGVAQFLRIPKRGVAAQLLHNAEHETHPEVARRNLALALEHRRMLHPNRRWRAILLAARDGNPDLAKAARGPLIDALRGERTLESLNERALLLALSDAPLDLRLSIIARLADTGTEAAVAPLTELADAFFGRGLVKAAAKDALTAIIGRLGALQAGRLALSEANEGALSLPESS
jgi:hypothetical protein